MTHITPQQFKEAFLQAATTNNTVLCEKWDWLPDRTLLMLKTISPATAQILNIKVYSGDYYTLDSIYYTENDTVYFPLTSTYAKYICVALEFESDVTRTKEEISKLQLFNTPLKVLITYTQHAFVRDQQLECYANILRGADVFGDFPTHRRQLVIFGDKQETAVNWHFYVYEATGFQEIRDPSPKST